MRLKAEQLANHLRTREIAPVYFLSGDEPLQMLELSDGIRLAAREQGCEERVVLEAGKDFEWDQLVQAGAELSLFARRRLIELRLGRSKPGREGAKALDQYLTHRDTGDILLVTSEKIDKAAQQTGWFRALDAAGVTVQLWDIDAGRLPGWITGRTQAHGKKIERDAAAFIAARVEGNLLAAKQEIDKLVLLVNGDTIDLRDAMESVSDSSRFDVFELVASSLSGDSERIVRMLHGLRSEGAEPKSIFGALMWEFRRVCSISHEVADGRTREEMFAYFKIWKQRQSAINAVLTRYSRQELHGLLRQAFDVDRAVKGAVKAGAWDGLENFLLAIAGHSLQARQS